MRSLFFSLGLLLAATVAHAQQPALPGAPQPGASPTPVPPTGAPPVSNLPGEIIGQAYSVELLSGTSFIGTLQAATALDLTFSTKDLGTVTVQRSNLRQLALLTPAQARRGFDNVGNGTRLLFGPTARNLRKGEGYVQNADVFLVGVNYGISDNFSIGTLFTFVPSAGADNFFSLTPKLSFPVGRADNLHVGAGAILGVTRGGTFGVTYANGTYGSADNNLTVGLGYGFADGSFSSTPVVVLGGASRVSRRLSLMGEFYYFRTSDSYSKDNYLLGIVGVRLASTRFSGSLGVLFSYYSEEYQGYYGGTQAYSHVDGLPYAEASYRFGRVK